MDKDKEYIINECIKEIANNSNDMVNKKIASVLVDDYSQKINTQTFQKILDYSWDRYNCQAKDDYKSK